MIRRQNKEVSPASYEIKMQVQEGVTGEIKAEKALRIVMVGTAKPGTTCVQRYRAMQELGHQVRRVDMKPADVVRRERTLAYRLYRKLVGPIDLAGANLQIIRAFKEEPAEVLWLEKGLTIKRQTLKTIKEICPECVVVGYSPDDMMGNPANQSRQFFKHLDCYDMYFTTKTYCVEELRALGCRRVMFNANAYDPMTHRPYEPNALDRQRLGGQVGFIGAWEPSRDETLEYLARADIKVRVWGGGWERSRLRHRNIRIENKPLWNEDYARGICNFDINLNFLRRCNRDLQTQRSVEIPACGGFMLAERTEEHQALFEEGKEAAYFEGNEELIETIQYYLAQPEKRKAIAAAGRKRCLKGGYSYHERIDGMLRLALAGSDRGSSS